MSNFRKLSRNKLFLLNCVFQKFHYGNGHVYAVSAWTEFGQEEYMEMHLQTVERHIMNTLQLLHYKTRKLKSHMEDR